MSIARSEISSKSRFDIKQTKSVDGFDEYPTKFVAQWYNSACSQVINPVPSVVPLQKHSQPYRLIIDKVSNISITKKSVHSAVYLRIMVSLVTTDLILVGKTCYYQCETPVSADGRYTDPICFYYHSKIDRAFGGIKMIIRFDALQLRDGMVESIVPLGFALVNSPFREQEIKNMAVFKQCSQIQAVTGVIQNPNVSNLSLAYRIQSTLELKNIIKLIPSQMIVSSQTHISGLFQDYPPQQKSEPIQEADIVFVNIKSCQIHIPQKFQQQVKATLKQIPFSDRSQNISLKKIVCGFHNQFQMISPVIRNLDLLGKEQTGEAVINVYEGLGDNQLMKVPYYLQDRSQQNLSCLTISLVYSYDGSDYEIAMYAFNPNLQGSLQQISTSMIVGSGFGFYTNLLPIKSNKPPTIIFQYISEEPLKVHQFDQNRTKSANRLRTQHRLPIRSTKQGIESSKFMEELERERLQLQNQKQHLQFLKTQHYVNYQDDFQKKLQEEREQLRLRQQLIQNQYKEEVQKEIRHKMELQNQIRLMKQKLAVIEQGYKSQMPSRKLSYQQSPAGEYDPSYTQPHNMNLPFRQKVNPNYLLQQQKTIPINQVRDIMAKTFQFNRQAIEKQLKFFNYASKFTFTFNSVIWSQFINPPKSFYFVIRFFNFKQFTTDPLSYVQSDLQYHQLIRMHHYTYNLEDTTPCYIFTVDPSQYANPELLQEDLVNFMCKNNTVVDIFDAENYLYIGQINIKMNELLRGSKSQVMIAKQYNMVRMKGQQNYGVIQILIKNQMIDCKQRINLNEKKKVRQIQKKIVSNNPILLSKQLYEDESQKEQVGGIAHARNRQQKRIEMYKKKVSEGKRKNIYEELQPAQKGNILDKINQYKQKKMPDMIKKIYENLLTEQIIINPYFGQAKTFIYQFTNMSHTPSSFRVSIQGDENELSLIKDISQWKYFVSLNRYPAPKIYDSINDQNSFYLSAGQTIPLLFRYLSFNKGSNTDTKSQSVTITKQENNWIVGGFTLQVQSHQSVINHSYVLYQPGNQLIDLIIPVVYSSNQVKTPKRLFLNIEEASAEWVNQFQILLRVRTPQIMSKLKFNMLLYEDDYFCELRENWLIQLFAYEGVYAVSRPDQKTRFKISVPEHVISSLRPGRINFFSSCPELMFETQFIEGIRLTKGSAQVWCQLFPRSSDTGSIQITCVSQRKQLLYGWVVQVYPYSSKMA